jgi:DNA anti-recombination protein RmuC
MPPEENPSVASKVEAIYAEAERSAASLREEILRNATQQADATVTAANRRATETEEAANRRATEVREEAEAQAAQYLADCRERIDAFAEERIRRLSEITDELIEQAEGLRDRFEGADTVKRQLYDLVAALGRTAETVAREHASVEEALPAGPPSGPVQARATRGAPAE